MLLNSIARHWTKGVTQLTTAHICLRRLVFLFHPSLYRCYDHQNVFPGEETVRGLTTSIQAVLQAIVSPSRIPLIGTPSKCEPQPVPIDDVSFLEIEARISECVQALISTADILTNIER